MPDGIRKNREAVAETIENNVRSKIMKERLIDPAYFEEMSILLDAIIKERKENAVSYEKYLKKIADLAARVSGGKSETAPKSLNTPAKRALYNNLDENEESALLVHESMETYRPAGWRDNPVKERMMKGRLYKILKSEELVEKIFPVIKEQSEY